MKNKLLAILAVCLLAGPMVANAGLIGSTVNFQYYAYGGPYSGAGSPTVFTADGAAHAQFASYFNITVTDNQVIYDYNGPADDWSDSVVSLNTGGLFITNGSLLTFAGAPAISSVSLNAATNMAGFTASNVTFNGTNVAVDWQLLSFDSNTLVVLDINTGTASVPAPGTLALLGLGLAGLGVTRRRRLN